MKKVYVRPTIEIENFEANEYVAGCYTIECEHKTTNVFGVTLKELYPIEKQNVYGYANAAAVADAFDVQAQGNNYYHEATYTGLAKWNKCKVTISKYQPAGTPNISQ